MQITQTATGYVYQVIPPEQHSKYRLNPEFRDFIEGHYLVIVRDEPESLQDHIPLVGGPVNTLDLVVETCDLEEGDQCEVKLLENCYEEGFGEVFKATVSAAGDDDVSV